MSMFSEVVHEQYAKEYEDLILKAFKSSDWADARSAVKGFARKELYPKYLEACSRAYSSPKKKIVKLFNEGE